MKASEHIGTIQKSEEPFEFVDFTYKTIVVGNSGVGKTSFIRRAVSSKFEENHIVTIAADFSKVFYKAAGRKIKLQMWDTCGLEQYRSINKMYFRGANIAMILYDSTNEKSFDACGEWLKDVKENCSAETSIYLVGTKTDLPAKRVTSAEAEDFRVKNDLTEKCEISAKTGDGIDLMLKYIIRKQLEKERIAMAVQSIFGDGTKKLVTTSKGKSGCC